MRMSFMILKIAQYASQYILGINFLPVNHRKSQSFLQVFFIYHFSQLDCMW
jgi:hypothetical protein